MALPLERYDALITDGQLTNDTAQRAAIEHLTGLSLALQRARGNWLQRVNPFARQKPRPRGIYMWGGVGRGKTLLMDLFFNNTQIASKQRVHFHEFMQTVHAKIAHWRGLDEAQRMAQPNYVSGVDDDPIAPVARAIAQQGRVICFDEFHVNDIADAMILGRLFNALFSEGVVVVTTSNRHPDDLYKDGLNRGLFLPFIDRIKQELDIVHLDAMKDYRLDRLAGQKVYFTPLDQAASDAIDGAWAGLVAGATEQPHQLLVQGRTINVERTARGSARFEFAQLCQRPLGANDYLAIAQCYSAIVLENIPIMTANDRNEAKRFVTLIDSLYDQGVKVIASAAGPPHALYRTGSETFEFERTVSRLIEMQSTEYLSCERL